MSQIIHPDDPEWKEWLDICAYTGWAPEGNLKPMRYHGRIVPYNKAVGIGPRFFNELMERIHKIKPIRMAIVGEEGNSKSYTAIELARLIDKNFTIDQVILSSKGYMSLVRTLKSGQCIVLEEPTFHLAARTWFNDWQRIIVQTIESTRFQNNPLFIPVVNLNLLDKTIREYYINYVVVMFDRGIGRVYRVKHSQWEDKRTRSTAFNLYCYTPGFLLQKCGVDSCLKCAELSTCNKYIYPQYERIRAEMISFYQQEGESRIGKTEEKGMSYSQLEKMTLKLKDRLKVSKKGSYDHISLLMAFEEEYGIVLPENKAKMICKRLRLRVSEDAGKERERDPLSNI